MFSAAQEDDSLADHAADRTQPNIEPEMSEYDTLTAQLLQNPHQPEAWRRLVHVAEATGEISKISAAYDALLKQYPNTVCGGSRPFP